MPRLPLHQLLLAAILVLGVPAMTAAAQTPAVSSAAVSSDGTLLSVSAQAQASRAPDVAILSTGVVTQAADANAAMRANATQMEKVMSAIRAAGIAERDIQTSGINLGPQYRYAENQPPVITGYQASNTVSLKVRDIAKLGDVLDALVASGANQINGPAFEIDEPEAVYDQARRAALEKAQRRADMYAKTLDLRVRRIVSISEGAGFQPPMPMMAMARMEKADASTPVSPGETTLTAKPGCGVSSWSAIRQIAWRLVGASVSRDSHRELTSLLHSIPVLGPFVHCAAPDVAFTGRSHWHGAIETAAPLCGHHPTRTRRWRVLSQTQSTRRWVMAHAISTKRSNVARLHPDASRIAGLQTAITFNAPRCCCCCWCRCRRHRCCRCRTSSSRSAGSCPRWIHPRRRSRFPSRRRRSPRQPRPP